MGFLDRARQVITAGQHAADIKRLQEAANLPGNNMQAQTRLHVAHSKKFHQGVRCPKATKALQPKKRK